MKKEKTFVYMLKTLLFAFLYVTLTGCGGGNTASTPTANNPTQDNDNNTSTDNDNDSNNTSDTNSTQSVNDTGIPWKDHGALKVSSDKQMIQHSDGTGFFWMADTAWFLYKKTNAEIDLYINNRAQKKFTVIQAVAIHNHTSYITPDYDKADKFIRAFIDYDITKPNEDYWKHIDYMIKKAEEKGLYVALLPVWRDAMSRIVRGSVTRTLNTVDDARNYGKWIANRYKNQANIIWVVGGDAPLDTKWATEAGMNIPDQIARWNALGEGIKSVDANHLRTFHPGPKVKKPHAALNNNSWMDFNMIQSSRFGPVDSIRDISVALDENLPTVDGESLYEDLAYPEKTKDGKTTRGESTRRNAFQIREDAYSQLFAGAFGNTYGHDAIWRFCVSVSDDIYTGDGECGSKATFLLKPKVTWQTALNASGGMQMKYVTELMQSRPIVGRKPDQSLIGGHPSNLEGIVATLGNGYAMVYSAQGKNINIEMGKVSGDNVKAWWYNPRNGESTLIGEFTNSGQKTFNPQDNNDWVLVLDDASKGFSAPGK